MPRNATTKTTAPVETGPRGVRHAAATWAPPAWRLHPLVGSCWLVVVGWTLHWLHASVVVTGLLVALAGVVVAGVAARGCPEGARPAVYAAVGVGAAGAGVWLLLARDTGPLTLPGVAGLVLLACYGAVVTWALADKVAPAIAAHEQAQAKREDAAEFLRMWTDLLGKAGMVGARATHRTDDARDDGAPLTGYTVTVDGQDGNDGVVTASVAAGKLEKLAGLASVRLAKSDHRVTLGENALTVTPSDVAFVWFLHVSVAPPLAGELPYRTPTRPGTFTDGLRIGFTEHGRRWVIRLLRGHWKLVGESQSGKSTLLWRILAELLAMSDVVVWVVGVTKVQPLTAAWLVPWLRGTTTRPVFDWVAADDRTALAALESARHLELLRNAHVGVRDTAHQVTREQPALVILLDESQDFLTSRGKVTTFDGHERTASQLVRELTARAASAGIDLIVAGQAGVIDAYGDEGTFINRNLTVRSCGRTNSAHDAQETLPNLSNPRADLLRDHMWLHQGRVEDATAERVKCEFIAPAAVEDIAVALTGWRPESVDTVHAAKLGPAYRARWEPEHHEDLARACRAEGWTWPTERDTPPAVVGATSGEHTVIQDLEEMYAAPDAVRAESGKGPRSLGEVGEALRAAFADASASIAATPAEAAPPEEEWLKVPEPLRTIAQALQSPSAPQEFVSSARLAFLCDRLTREQLQGDDGDSTRARLAAATRLGQDITRLCPEVTSGKLPRHVDPTRPRGFKVPDLLDAAASFVSGDRAR